MSDGRATSNRVPREPEEGILSLGFDKDGDEHTLGAERNLSHTPDPLCGCNPDAYNTENPYGGEYRGVWVWFHHPFEDEL